MITITYVCQHCENATRAEVRAEEPAVCMHCGQPQEIAHQAFENTRMTRCLICTSTELYVRKDFSQPLGITIIVSGFVLASIAWFLHYSVLTYSILVGTAAIDALLYLVTGNTLHCYRCHSELRGLADLDQNDAFDLEVFERHRQQAARLELAERKLS